MCCNDSMFIRRDKRKGGAHSVRIIKGQRIDGKVKHKTILTVGMATAEVRLQEIEAEARDIIVKIESGELYINRLGNVSSHKKKRKKKKTAPSPSPEMKNGMCATCRERPVVPAAHAPPAVRMSDVAYCHRVSNGVFDVFGQVYDAVGLQEFISGTQDDAQWNEVFKALVIARLDQPDSKRGTATILSRDYRIHYPLHKYYRAMDKAERCKNDAMGLVLKETKRLHGGHITVALFDVTTLYFESCKQDGLREYGYSKDNKFGEVQIVLSLMVTDDGLPVGYKLFAGNTAEGKTLLAHIKSLRQRFRLKGVTLIADRAMFTRQNLQQMEALGINYIVASKLKTLKKDIKDRLLTDVDFVVASGEGDLHWSKEYEHEGKRLIVSYSSQRAARDREKRETMIKKVMNKVKNGKIKAADALNNRGIKRFLNLRGVKLEIDQDEIGLEARWDGIHGVISSDRTRSSAQILSDYRQLWKIEDAFRFNKSDLQMRPVYHWKPERIEAHVLICYLAFAVQRFALQRINADTATPKSFSACLQAMRGVESIVMVDCSKPRGSFYVLPSQLTSEQQEMYRTVGLQSHQIRI